MVRRDGERFAMLETIREFALERLQEGGEAGAIAERHAAHFEALAERCHARRWHHEKEGLDQLSADHDNLRTGARAHRGQGPAAGIGAGRALGWFWHLRSHVTEGRGRLAAALAAAPAARSPFARARTRRRRRARGLGGRRGERAAADEEAVAIWRESGEEKEVACALVELDGGASSRAIQGLARRWRRVSRCS
jgi:hypothetical protein